MTNKLLIAVSEVLEVVDTKDFIKHIYELKKSYKKDTFQDRIIQNIITSTCNAIGITKNDILHTKNRYNGRRIKAYGIIGMFIKVYVPHLSLKRICNELNNNVTPTNLHLYNKRYKDFKPNEKIKQDIETAQQIDEINNKIIKFLNDEKLR